MLGLFLLTILTVCNKLIASDTCGDPISCYFNSVVIPIPDFSLPVPPGTLYITDLTCYNPMIQAVPSSYIPPSSINVVVDNFSITCSGLFTYLLTSGTVSIDFSDASLNVTTTVVNEAGYPTAFLVPHCSASAGNIDIVFKGNVGTGLLNMLANALAAFLEKASSVLVCSLITQAVEVNGTQALQSMVDPALEEVVEAAAAPAPVFGSDMVDWQEVDQLVNSGLVCLTSHHPHVAERLQRPAVNWLMDLATWGSGEALLPLNQTLTLGNSSALRLNSLSVRGLDSFSAVSLFAPDAASNVTILSSASLSQLAVQLNVTYEWSGGEGPYSQALVLDLSLANSTLAAATVLALSKSIFGSLYLDQLVQPGCLLQTVTALSLSSLTLATTVETAALTQTAGGSAAQPEKDVAGLLDTALLLAVHGFGPLLSGLVSGLVQGTLRPLIDEELSVALAAAQSKVPCTHALSDGPAFIVWSNSSLVRATDALLDQLLGAQGLNALLRCATNGTGAALLYSDGALSVGVRGLDSLRYLALAEALPDSTCAGGRPLEQSIVTPLQPPLPLPPHPYDLSTRVGMGACSSAPLVGCSPVYLDISYTMNSQPRGWRLNGTSLLGDKFQSWATDSENRGSTNSRIWSGNNMFGPFFNGSTVGATGNSSKLTLHASLGAADLFLFASSEIQVSAALAANLRLNQLRQPGCLAATMESLVLLQLSAQASAVSLQLSVTNSTNFTSFNTGNPVDVSKEASLMFHAMSGAPALALLNRAIDRRLAGANSTCTDSSGGDVVSDDTAAVNSGSASGIDYAYWATPVAIILAMAAVALLVRWRGEYIRRRSEKRQLNDFEQQLLSEAEQAVEDPDDLYFWQRWAWRDALLFHPSLALWLRIFILLDCLANVALYIDSNQEPSAATVVVTVRAAAIEQSFSVFEMGLVKTVNDMWEAQTYSLAILIAFFSGGWPYIKMFAMLTCFTLPPQALSIRTREIVLRTMDVLGKWSLIDCFVMVIFSCAFYFQITIGHSGAGVFVTVHSCWGFYSYILAILNSLVLGHIIIACHRYVLETSTGMTAGLTRSFGTKDTVALSSDPDLLLSPGSRPDGGVDTSYKISSTMSGRDNDPASQPTAMIAHVYWVDQEYVYARYQRRITDYEAMHLALGEGGTATVGQNTSLKIPVSVSRRGAALLVFLFVAAAAATLFGAFVDTMEFIFEGLTGLLLKDAATVDYSLVGLGLAFPSATGTPGNWAVKGLQASLFAFALSMPLAMLLASLCLWLTPLSLRALRRGLAVAEVLNAWAALDVYCISVVASVMQLPLFSAFIVGDNCDGLNVILAEYFDTLLNGEDYCFEVVSVIKPISVVLFAAAALQLVLSLLSLTVLSRVIEDRSVLSLLRLRPAGSLEREQCCVTSGSHSESDEGKPAPDSELPLSFDNIYDSEERHGSDDAEQIEMEQPMEEFEAPHKPAAQSRFDRWCWRPLQRILLNSFLFLGLLRTGPYEGLR